MFSAGISADLEFRVDRSKRYNFYRDRRKQGDFAETVENATKQGDRINPDIGCQERGWEKLGEREKR